MGETEPTSACRRCGGGEFRREGGEREGRRAGVGPRAYGRAAGGRDVLAEEEARRAEGRSGVGPRRGPGRPLASPFAEARPTGAKGARAGQGGDGRVGKRETRAEGRGRRHRSRHSCAHPRRRPRLLAPTTPGGRARQSSAAETKGRAAPGAPTPTPWSAGLRPPLLDGPRLASGLEPCRTLDRDAWRNGEPPP